MKDFCVDPVNSKNAPSCESAEIRFSVFAIFPELAMRNWAPAFPRTDFALSEKFGNTDIRLFACTIAES
jgi:hypothetical protein